MRYILTYVAHHHIITAVTPSGDFIYILTYVPHVLSDDLIYILTYVAHHIITH